MLINRSIRIPLVVSGTLTAICAAAQPTLDQGNAPIVGFSYSVAVADPVLLPGTGPGQTWDASGTFQSNTLTVDQIDLSASTAGASFPNAEVVSASGVTEDYIDVASDGLYIVGAYNASLPITSVYTNAYQYLQFPCTLGTSWTDTYAGSYTYGANTYAQSGTGTYEATGYGSLVLPWGTVDNVLRIDGTELYQESGNGSVYEYEASFSFFYKPGVGHYVAKGIASTSELNGSPAGDQEYFLFLEANSIGIGERALSSIGLEVFPNPASDEAVLVFTAEGGVTLTVLDAAGRTVMDQALPRSGAGLFREVLDVRGLPTGLYTAVVNGSKGERGSTRFVVDR